MTIEEIKAIEPKLQGVENHAKRHNSPDYKWWQVWQNCKSMMHPLIGWDAENEKLRSSECWDAFHNHLNKLTPKCK